MRHIDWSRERREEKRKAKRPAQPHADWRLNRRTTTASWTQSNPEPRCRDQKEEKMAIHKLQHRPRPSPPRSTIRSGFSQPGGRRPRAIISDQVRLKDSDYRDFGCFRDSLCTRKARRQSSPSLVTVFVFRGICTRDQQTIHQPRTKLKKPSGFQTNPKVHLHLHLS